jgi:hypothetical protein
MRRRERTFFLLLGSLSAFALTAGAWPVPLLTYAALEGSFTLAEAAAARRARVVAAARAARAAYRMEGAAAILHPAS